MSSERTPTSAPTPLATVDADTGQVLGEREIAVTEQGYLEGLRWRTRRINRLRWNLVVLDPELEAKIPSHKLDYPGPATAHHPAAPSAAIDGQSSRRS